MKPQNRSKYSLILNLLTLILLVAVIFLFCVCACASRAYNNSLNSAFKNESITATISFDRKQNMQNGNMQGMPNFDDKNDKDENFGGDNMPPSNFNGEMPSMPENGFDVDFSPSVLTLSDYAKYASSAYVKEFTYTATAYLNGVDILPTNSDDIYSGEISGSITEGADSPDVGFDTVKTMSDFSLVGYSKQNQAREAITLLSGAFFCEGSIAYECVISSSIADINELSLGDKITLCDINDADKQYTLTICGIYSSAASNAYEHDIIDQTSDDRIFVNAETLSDIAGDTASINAVYSFDNIDSYISFKADVYTLGLDKIYSVTSASADHILDTLSPLKSVSSAAKIILIPLAVVGALIVIAFSVLHSLKLKKHITEKHIILIDLAKRVSLILLTAFVLSIVCSSLTSNKIITSFITPISQQPSGPANENDTLSDYPGNVPQAPGIPDAPGDIPNAAPNPSGGPVDFFENTTANVELTFDIYAYIFSLVYVIILFATACIASVPCVVFPARKAYRLK